MLNEGLAPGSELPVGVDWKCRQGREAGCLREVLHRFAQQCFLGSKLAEERNFVYAGGISDATGRRSTKSVLREYAGGSGKDLVSARHGRILPEQAPLCKYSLTYTGVSRIRVEGEKLTKASELANAFDAALEEVKRTRDKGMTTLTGSPAGPELDQLASELSAERARAVERGRVDREWFQRTLKWVVSWIPEEDLKVIAALGRIVRAQPQITAKKESG